MPIVTQEDMLYPPVKYMKTYDLYFSFHSCILFFRTIFHTSQTENICFPVHKTLKKYLLTNLVPTKRTQLFDINQIKRNIWKFSLYSLGYTIFLAYLCSVKRERHYFKNVVQILTIELHKGNLSN